MAACFAVLACWLGQARAQALSVNGFGDLRLVVPSGQRPSIDGGLAKLGTVDDRSAALRLSELIADIRVDATPDLMAFSTVRYDRDQKTALDVLEAYARYQPNTSGPVRWTIKLGAFFPPISLENEAVGWSSPWSLTSSAINSWVGEELRTIGGEATAEWRFDGGKVEAQGAVFGWNDPAGALLADRGWALNDRPVGLVDTIRLPDAIGIQFHSPTPVRSSDIMEIDNAPGWYAGISARGDDLGRLSVLRYENRADPALDRNDTYAWRTEFTSVGLETGIGDVTILAQAMDGFTEIDPSPSIHNGTDFQSAYLLAGWTIDDWTLAARAEVFATQNHHPGTGLRLSEHGDAFTAAAGWKPKRWLRLTAEIVRLESVRQQRIVVGLAPDEVETELQLSARLFF
jgi:hypothetical protein